MENKPICVSLKGITKIFGSTIANSDVSFDIYKGEILSLLGENGSGKTTLMNMLSGIYYPDKGEIYVDNNKVSISSPKDAYKLKIGMVHQHFKLIDVFTAYENIILGTRVKNHKETKTKIQSILDKYGFEMDLNKKVYDMGVSEKQTLEIIKVLFREAEILILDEPTAVLTPIEIDRLFSILKAMRDDNKTIIIITHKLNEVMEISDRVVILRKGEFIKAVSTSSTNEDELTEFMVGKKVELNIKRSDPVNPEDRLIIKDLSVKNSDGLYAIKDINFTCRSGEVLGIAGISNSGQKELLEAIAGLNKIDSGSITYIDKDNDNKEINLIDKTPLQIRELGVRLSFVPEDRLGMGLVGNMGTTDNMMLRSYSKGHNIFLNRHDPKLLAERIIAELEVKTPSRDYPVRSLSGGNVQKVLVGREISSNPKVLMAAYPVRGLDINSSYTIYNLLNKQKENGAAVIFVGEDLDVLIELSDRILVINNGRISGIVDGRGANKREIGFLMTKKEIGE